MLLRLFRYPVLFLCLWSLLPGIAELSHGSSHDETVQEKAISSNGVEAPSEHGMPCESDCDDEKCVDHFCHFGHCRILTTIASLHSFQQKAQFLLAPKFSTPNQALVNSLFRPPVSSLLS